jgi:hypothetical protein
MSEEMTLFMYPSDWVRSSLQPPLVTGRTGYEILQLDDERAKIYLGLVTWHPGDYVIWDDECVIFRQLSYHS